MNAVVERKIENIDKLLKKLLSPLGFKVNIPMQDDPRLNREAEMVRWVLTLTHKEQKYGRSCCCDVRELFLSRQPEDTIARTFARETVLDLFHLFEKEE